MSFAKLPLKGTCIRTLLFRSLFPGPRSLVPGRERNELQAVRYWIDKTGNQDEKDKDLSLNDFDNNSYRKGS